MRIHNQLIIFIIFINIIGCENRSKNKEDNLEQAQLDSIIALYHKGNFDECISRAKLFTVTYPSNDKGWHSLSSAYLDLGEDSLSELSAKKALSINPNNVVALTNMGILLDKKKRYSEAKEYYLKAIKLNPNIAQIYSNYASNRLYSNDYIEAIKYGEIAVKMADNIKDKGILCLSYHKAGMINKRDSIYKELEELNYKHLDDLYEIFNKDSIY